MLFRSDSLNGQGGDDILIGGDLSASYTYASLRSLADSWAASTAGSPSPGVVSAFNALLAATTDPLNANEYDILTGGVGKDAFLYRGGTGGDSVTDYNALEGDLKFTL